MSTNSEAITALIEVLIVALAGVGFVLTVGPLTQHALGITPKRMVACSAELRSEFNVTTVRMTTCEVEE